MGSKSCTSPPPGNLDTTAATPPSRERLVWVLQGLGSCHLTRKRGMVAAAIPTLAAPEQPLTPTPDPKLRFSALRLQWTWL